MTSRSYCFTSFDLTIWSQVNVGRVIEEGRHKVRYLVFQIEVCPETKRLHAQGYAEFTDAIRMNAFKSMFGDRTMHIEKRVGTREQARHYCMCSGRPCGCVNADKKIVGSGPFEFGEWIRGQGQRTDLSQIQEAISEGAGALEIADANFGFFIRNEKAINNYRNLVISPRNFKTELHIVWGPPGSGKAMYCFNKYAPESFYRCSATKGYFMFDGYDPNIHENILIKGFRGEVALPKLLELCDSFPLHVKIMYGTVQFVAKRVFITSNESPLYWYLPPSLTTPEPKPDIKKPYHSVEIMPLLNSIKTLEYRSGHWSMPGVADRTRKLQQYLSEYYSLSKDGDLPDLSRMIPGAVKEEREPLPFPDWLKTN